MKKTTKQELVLEIEKLEQEIKDLEYNIQENQRKLQAMYGELDELRSIEESF